MSPINYQLPTLGQFNKVLCDCLGLWASDGKSIKFHVPASEKVRREALRTAFESIKKDNGTYGSLDELVSVTSRIAPRSKEEVKKSKTIQSYVLHIAKDDYSSHDELIELSTYIKILVHEKYKPWGIDDFAVKFYDSAIMHYREFVREYSASALDSSVVYQGFLSGILIDLLESISKEESGTHSASFEERTIDRWPLKGLLESICNACEVSPYKLHQFHGLRKSIYSRNKTDKELWACDFTSKPVSTQSKQVFERLSKNRKAKWELIYQFFKPLSCLMTEDERDHAFARKVFCAFVSHNLYMYAAEIGEFDPDTQPHYPKASIRGSLLPISDQIDELLNVGSVNDQKIQSMITAYRELLQCLRSTESFLTGDISMPGALDALYKRDYLRFSTDQWHKLLVSTPCWIEDWILARDNMLAGANESALQNFKLALRKAKYSAGPLFFPFYVHLCAFCKSQYKKLSDIGEEQLFDRFYEPLGSEASKYACLLGYTPSSSRDPETLLPKSNLRIKNTLIIQEIDLLAKALRDVKAT